MAEKHRVDGLAPVDELHRDRVLESVSGRSFEVIGDSSVVVIDARPPDPPKIPVIKVTSGGGDGPPPTPPAVVAKTATLNPGMMYDLDRGIIPDQAP